MSPCSASAGRPEPKKVLKYVSKAGENVFKSSKSGKPGAFQTFYSVTIINLPFLRVPENFIGFRGYFKFFLRLFIAGISVWMVLHCNFSVTLFYLLLSS